MPDQLSLQDLQKIADVLSGGFQALQQQIDQQKVIEVKLRQRLERAFEKYEQVDRSCNSSSAEISDWRDEIVRQISPPSPYENTPTPTAALDMINKAQQTLQYLRESKMPTSFQVQRCPVTHKTTDQEDFEHDFTTPGRIGDLGCPFAKMSNGTNPPCGPDPIAEEFHNEKASGWSKSSGAAGSRCPIRFLDKHSPEEVAQYFENHKHEIPRSHQICVKRYQRNEDSIRQLDAKYGNLVSMIQGLGSKHKQYLPQNEKVAGEPEQDSTKAVEKWAENVSHHSEPAAESDRIPHFERPLRDIRVGESPSRPWGISVPVGKSPAASAVPSVDGIQPSAKPLSTAPAPAPAPTPADISSPPQIQKSKAEQVQPNSQPQIIFNGPVFFGYTAEQAALFLQNLNFNGSATP